MDLIQQLRTEIEQQVEAITRRGVVVSDEFILEKITLTVEPDLVINACQALVQNAIKYNRPNGKIIMMSQASSDRRHIIVADTGVGMKPDQCKAVTSEIEKGLRQTGLKQVWSLLQATQGAWHIESQLNVGTQLSLSWPLL